MDLYDVHLQLNPNNINKPQTKKKIIKKNPNLLSNMIGSDLLSFINLI